MGEDKKQELSTEQLLAALVGALPLIVWQGFFMSLVWSMFVVPMGAASITPLHAGGLSILVHWATGIDGKVTAANFTATILRGVWAPPLVWAVAWAVHALDGWIQ